MKKFILIVLTVITIVGFWGCNQESTPPITKKGWFVDAPMAGLAYKTSSGITGITDEKGMYEYKPGDTVTFLLGQAQLGKTVDAAAVVTPCSLTGTDSISNDSSEAKEALNMVKLFLALDSDSSDFGLSLDKKLSTENLTTESLSALLESSDFVADIKSLLGEETVVPTNEEAKKHYNQVAGQIDGEEDLSHHEKLLPVLQRHFEWYPENSLAFACYFPEGINCLVIGYESEAGIENDGVYHNPYINEDWGWVAGWTSQCENCSKPDHYCSCIRPGNYNVNLLALHDNTKFSVGDLLCYYDGVNFQKTPQNTYPLTVKDNEKTVIYVDFTSERHNAAIEEVFKLSGEITVDDIEQAGVNSGKKLEAMPLYLIAFLSDTVYVPLDVIPAKKIKDGGKIIFSYETYLPKEINRVQVGYKPFVDDYDTQWMESSSVTMTENKEVDFSLECEL